MRNILLPAALVAGLLLGCGAATPGSSTSGTASGSAPDFRLRTAEGDTFRLSDHLGSKVIVLSFWTSFCPSCRTELTNLQPLFEELKDEGLLVVAVALDGPDTVGDVRPTRDRLGLTFPVVLDEESRVAGLYNPRAATPFTVIIDGQGNRVSAHEGFVPGDMPELEAKLRGLVAELHGGAGPATPEAPPAEPVVETPPATDSPAAAPGEAEPTP